MKIKSASQTANLGKDHNYLGHFRKDNVLNQGHNDGPNLYRYNAKTEDLFTDEKPRPQYKFEPTLDVSEEWASYSGTMKGSIPISKNATLNLEGGASGGRGVGKYKGEKSKLTPYGSAELEIKF